MDKKESGRTKLDAFLCAKKICEQDLALGLKYRKQTAEERLARPTVYGMAEYPMTDEERKHLQEHIDRLNAIIIKLQSEVEWSDGSTTTDLDDY